MTGNGYVLSCVLYPFFRFKLIPDLLLTLNGTISGIELDDYTVIFQKILLKLLVSGKRCLFDQISLSPAVLGLLKLYDFFPVIGKSVLLID